MKLLLTETEFLEAVQGTRLKAKSIEIAHLILVDGRQQAEIARQVKRTEQRVSDIVARVRKSYVKKKVVPQWTCVTFTGPKEVTDLIYQLSQLMIEDASVQKELRKEYIVNRKGCSIHLFLAR